MAVNIHITIIELNALHTKRQNLFQELDAVIHLLMEDRKSGSAGMPRPISYAVFCLKKKNELDPRHPRGVLHRIPLQQPADLQLPNAAPPDRDLPPTLAHDPAPTPS